MSISEPCYTTREEVKYSLDAKSTARNDSQVDRAIQSASRSVESRMRRVFYPELTTKYFDWPNFQNAYPWRIWFDQAEIADITGTVPVVTSGGNVIPAANIFWGNPRYAPPYSYLEINRSTSSSFGQGSTPQRDVAITGLFGGCALSETTVGTVAEVLDSSETGVDVDGQAAAAVGVGSILRVDTERMLVTERTWLTTGQTLQTPVTAVDNVVTMAVTTGSSFSINEVILLDAEKMLITDISGNNLTVIRAWDGSVLASHTGSTIYGSRTLTVTRGALGTTAAAHLTAAPLLRYNAPSGIRELALAEAINNLMQADSGYARTAGSGDNERETRVAGLESLRKSMYSTYGRVSRTRVV